MVTKRELRVFPFYSQDLLNNLFTHPYTKVSFVEYDLGRTRITATKYLNMLAEHGLLRKLRAGRSKSERALPRLNATQRVHGKMHNSATTGLTRGLFAVFTV